MNYDSIPSPTICALSTPAGSGALAIIRVSGSEAIALCDRLFVPRSGAPLAGRRSHTATFGTIQRDGELLDEVVATVFRAPHPFTGEDTVEPLSNSASSSGSSRPEHVPHGRASSLSALSSTVAWTCRRRRLWPILSRRLQPECIAWL